MARDAADLPTGKVALLGMELSRTLPPGSEDTVTVFLRSPRVPGDRIVTFTVCPVFPAALAVAAVLNGATRSIIDIRMLTGAIPAGGGDGAVDPVGRVRRGRRRAYPGRQGVCRHHDLCTPACTRALVPQRQRPFGVMSQLRTCRSVRGLDAPQAILPSHEVLLDDLDWRTPSRADLFLLTMAVRVMAPHALFVHSAHFSPTVRSICDGLR